MTRPLPSSVIIETENFLIRPLGRDDACAALESWTEDETASEMLNAQRRRWSIAEQVACFAQHEGDPDRCLLGLFPKGQNEPVGLFILKLRPNFAVMNVTHLIGNKEWRGIGATREASIGIFEYFFNELGFEKATANVLPDNKAAQWLLLNGGWRQEAHLTRHLRLQGSGGRGDLYVFGILADEWRAKRSSANTVPRRKRNPPKPVSRP